MTLEAYDLDVRIKNRETGWKHVRAEWVDDVDTVLATLVPDGPYAYTVSPSVSRAVAGETLPTGAIPHQPFVSTMEGLRTSYENLHRFSTVVAMEAIGEITGAWYVFHYGVGHGRVKSTGEGSLSPTVCLFPTMGLDGITGELFWTRTAVGPFYDDGHTDVLPAQASVLAKHEALLAAMRSGDAAAVASFYDPNCQIGIRDHLTEGHNLVEAHSADDYKAYLERFFARFKVLELELAQRLVQEWFAFCELLWLVEDRETGEKLSFYTADHAECRPDGLFASRIGFGTDRKVV